MGKKGEPKDGKRRRVQDEPADRPAGGAGGHQADAQISFRSAEEIRRALKTTNTDLLIQGITHLREHLKACNRAVDERTAAEARAVREACRRVVYEWADESNGFEDVAAAWQQSLKHGMQRLEVLIPGTVGRLLETLDTPATLAHGRRLVRLVVDGFMKAVHRAFGTPRSALCASTLQLLCQMVAYGRGEHADEVRSAFDWTMKGLDDLPAIRSTVVGFSIRRLWIRFVLGFFAAERCQTSAELLRTRRLISGLFRGAEKDSYQELHALLSSVYAHIVLNGAIPRADKRRVFGVQLMGALAKAARNAAPVVPQDVGVAVPARFAPAAVVESGEGEEENEDEAPLTSDSVAALVVRFFRGMMTHPGHGICYRQYGLYPPPHRQQQQQQNQQGQESQHAAAAEDMHDVATFSKAAASAEMRDVSNSMILRILVACINPQGSRRMAELAVDIMRASPELIAPFWRNYRCALEPQLTLRFLGSSAFAIKVMALPLPVPAPAATVPVAVPRLNTLIEHVAPFALGRAALGRGLQMRAAPLVRYRTLLLVDMALRKLGDARAWIRAQGSDGGGGSGEWPRLERRLVAAVRQRMPEWKLVALVHHDLGAGEAAAAADSEGLREAECQRTVVGNVLMRVMSGYQAHFAELVQESHFEFGRLVAGVRLADVVAAGGRNAQRLRNPVAASTLLHLLRGLAAAPPASVGWLARVRAADDAADADAAQHQNQNQNQNQHTCLGVVLMVALFAAQPELRRAARRAAVCALRATGLFDHDARAAEAACWLGALAALASPGAPRAARLSFIPAGRLALGRGLVAFLEDAAAHAAKQPYRYADRVSAAAPAAWEPGALPFSPLLAAVAEAAVLKASAGNGALAARLRGAPRARIAREMQTNAAFAYVREVACRIADARGPDAARCLGPFLADAARAVLAPRAARLDASKAAAAAERQHYSAVEAAFADAFEDARMYVATLCALDSSRPTPARPAAADPELPRAVARRLKQALPSVCADVEARLAAFIAQLAQAVHDADAAECTRPVALVTRWLLAQAKRTAAPAARQAAFVVAITWIAQYDRVCLPGQSLWDCPLFAELAPEIMQIDDLAFLEALWRHFIMSRDPAALVVGSSPGVRRLLAHVMLAHRGSPLFCSLAAWLVASVARARDRQGRAAAFVCALIGRHAESMQAPASSASASASARLALESYAATLTRERPCADPGQRQVLEFGAATLARKSAEAWVPLPDAARIWAPLVARAAAAASAAVRSSAAHAASALAPVRLVSAMLPDDVRAGLVRDLGAAAQAHMPTDGLCAIACTALALIGDMSDAALERERGIREIGSALSARIVLLWSESLGSSSDARACAALEDAAKQATMTMTMGAALPRRLGEDATDIRRRIALVRARLPQLGGHRLVDAAASTVAAIEHLWRNAETDGASATKRLILARIMALNLPAQRAACEWAARAAPEAGCHLSAARGRLLAWLLSAVAAECSAVDALGRVVWDDDAHSRMVRARCLALARELFGGPSAAVVGDLLLLGADEDALFLANAFVQGTEDIAAASRLSAAVAQQPLPVRASILRSRIVRSPAQPGQQQQQQQQQPDTAAAASDAVAELMRLARHAIPPLEEAMDPAAAADPLRQRAVSTLAAAAQHLQQTVAQRPLSDAAACVASVAGGIGGVLESMCRPFKLGADMPEAEVRRAAGCYPPAAFRLVSFAIQAAADICAINGLAPDAGHGWFAALKRLLGCRLYSARACAGELRNPMALAVLGLWRLSRPLLSRWSASLDDYFALDELESLAGAYGGSRSLADHAILQVLQEYESATRQSIQRVALVFGPAAASTYTKERVGRATYLIERDENAIGVVGEDTVAAALASIDPSRMHRTIVDFPIAEADMALAAGGGGGGSGSGPSSRLPDALAGSADLDAPERAQVYDPQFILPWTWAVVSAGQGVDLRRVIECNAAGVAVAALSSSSAPVRRLAYYILDVLVAKVSAARDFAGKRQCQLLLDSLRNGITGRTEVELPRVPFPLAVFAATTLRTMLRPEHSMFGALNRLLLKRPYLRAGGIPLLRGALQSSTAARAQRAHALVLASHSARAFSQCPVAFRRCDLVNLVLALPASALGDVQAGSAALAVLFHLTAAANAGVLAEHVSKGRFSLMAWIRAQVALETNSLRAAASQARSPATMQALAAAAVNLVALARIVVRAAANYPLAVLASGAQTYNRFWAVTSAAQPDAAGQSAAMHIFEQTLDSLAHAAAALGDDALDARTARLALVLARTCTDGARLLADIQRTCGCGESPALRSPRIAGSALALVRLAEPAVEREAAVQRAASAVHYDPCSVASVARAEYPSALFATEATMAEQQCAGAAGLLLLPLCYRAAVESLFSWVLAAPRAPAHLPDSIEIATRALAVGAPAASPVVAWMRECHGPAAN